uniref:Beta-microseminoprotein-like n=1 Tax=Nothoprocta perdicaria TaxID=30464 RepID=A0A8C6ZQK3_NOTPE
MVVAIRLFNSHFCVYTVYFILQKTFLAFLFILVTCVTISDAFCLFEPLTAGKPGCIDSKGTLHQFGSHWRAENCLDCSCGKDGTSCCSSYATPVDFDEEKCESIFDKQTCSYKVVEKADHKKECPVFTWVG